MLENARPELKAATDTILACFGGADGGASFYKFMLYMEKFDTEAENGSDAAEKILNIPIQMARLIISINGKDPHDA